jgi:hypothetical protein
MPRPPSPEPGVTLERHAASGDGHDGLGLVRTRKACRAARGRRGDANAGIEISAPSLPGCISVLARLGTRLDDVAPGYLAPPSCCGAEEWRPPELPAKQPIQSPVKSFVSRFGRNWN